MKNLRLSAGERTKKLSANLRQYHCVAHALTNLFLFVKISEDWRIIVFSTLPRSPTKKATFEWPFYYVLQRLLLQKGFHPGQDQPGLFNCPARFRLSDRLPLARITGLDGIFGKYKGLVNSVRNADSLCFQQVKLNFNIMRPRKRNIPAQEQGF
jgi:hypothetical protein